mmetsp:Transcript_6233/g.13571  ORF Transcript_6233/g.13571 Transcript_6233/m.13571 type:complete len:175 (-) Transcript_6233:180-704(-)
MGEAQKASKDSNSKQNASWLQRGFSWKNSKSRSLGDLSERTLKWTDDRNLILLQLINQRDAKVFLTESQGGNQKDAYTNEDSGIIAQLKASSAFEGAPLLDDPSSYVRQVKKLLKENAQLFTPSVEGWPMPKPNNDFELLIVEVAAKAKEARGCVEDLEEQDRLEHASRLGWLF